MPWNSFRWVGRFGWLATTLIDNHNHTTASFFFDIQIPIMRTGVHVPYNEPQLASIDTPETNLYSPAVLIRGHKTQEKQISRLSEDSVRNAPIRGHEEMMYNAGVRGCRAAAVDDSIDLPAGPMVQVSAATSVPTQVVVVVQSYHMYVGTEGSSGRVAAEFELSIQIPRCLQPAETSRKRAGGRYIFHSTCRL